MALFDVTLTVKLSMRVEAGSGREAMDLCIAQCYGPLCEQIRDREVDVIEEEVQDVDE